MVGSLFGGGGGWIWSFPDPWSFLGKVEYCLDWLDVFELELMPGTAAVMDIDMTEGKGDADVEQTKLLSPTLPPPVLKHIWGRIVTTVNATKSPDFLIRPTTVSWLACLTSSPLIWNHGKMLKYFKQRKI